MIAAAFALSMLWSGTTAAAKDVRERIVGLYAGLNTPSLRLTVEARLLPDSVRGPEGATGWKVSRDGGKRPGGTEAVTLTWTSNENPSLRRDWLQVRVERQELVPLARGRIERGDRLDSSRVDWQWRSTTGTKAIPPEPDSLGKLQARSGISPGQPVWRGQLERVPLFHRGDLVMVQAGGKGASATVQAQAMDEGIPGGKTRVKSPWGKTLVGTTGADGTVIVH